MSDQNIPVTANGSVQIDCDNNDNNENEEIVFSHDNGTELMRIQENGRVGIGTTSPDANLHVSGGTGSCEVIIEADTNNFDESDQPSLTFRQDGGAVVGKLGFFDSVNHLTLKNVWSSGNLHLGTDDTIRVTIEPDGNVGIGATSPTEKLEVDGNIKLTDSTNDRVWATKKVYNVLDYGAVGDAVYLYDVVTTNGDQTVTSVSASWSSADIGKTIVLKRVGGSNADLSTTISSINSSTSIEVAAAPSVSDTGVIAVYGTENTEWFQNAENAADDDGGIVYVPPGYYLFTGNLAITSNVLLCGMWDNMPPQWNTTAWENGTVQGPVLLPTEDRGNASGTSFITLNGDERSAGVIGLTIYYPLQGVVSGSGGTSVVVESYPYSIDIASSITDSCCDHRVMNVQLVNPYQGINMEVTQHGRNHISGVFGCPLSMGINIDNLTDFCTIERIHFHPDFYVRCYTDAFAKDIRTYLAANLTGLQIKRADWIVLHDISAWMINRGLILDESGNGYPVLMGTNIQFDGVDCGIEIKGLCVANLTNVRINSGLEDNVPLINHLNGSITAFAYAGGVQVTVTSSAHGLQDNESVTISGTTNYNGPFTVTNVTTNTFEITATWSGDDATGQWVANNNRVVLDTEKAIYVSHADNVAFLTVNGGGMQTWGTHVVHWNNPGWCDICNMLFVDNSDQATTYGIYADDGRISFHDNLFQHNTQGFTNAVNITSGAEKSIVYGNDYRDNPTGSNSATNKALVVDGTIGIGTTNPGASLQIDHSGSGSKGLWLKSGSNATDGITVEADGITTSSYALLIYDSPDNKMWLDYTGKAYFGGSVGIGTTSPTSELHVDGDIEASSLIGGGDLESTVNGVIQIKTSDKKLKKKVKTIKDALEDVTKLRGVTFNWKDPKQGTGSEYGLVAQEVQKVFPDLVTKTGKGYLSVRYSSMVAILVQAMKEQQSQIEKLEKEMAKLKKKK